MGNCGKCANHHIVAPYKNGHKKICPNRNCDCSKCLRTTVQRKVGSTNILLYRASTGNEKQMTDSTRNHILKLRLFEECRPKLDELIEICLKLSGYAENTDIALILHGDNFNYFQIYF